MPDSDVTVNVSFTELGGTITVNQNTGGSIAVSPSTGFIREGTLVKVTVSENTGYSLTSLYANDLNITSSKEFFMPSSNVVITPSFGLQSYNITVSSVANGRITTIPTGSAYYSTSVRVDAYPNSGYALSSLTWNGNNIGNGSSFTMPASAVTVTGSFTRQRYNIVTSVPTGGGTLTTTPSGSALYGDTVQVNATPYTNWSLNSITVNGSRINNSFTMPAGTANVVANFTYNPPSKFTLTINGDNPFLVNAEDATFHILYIYNGKLKSDVYSVLDLIGGFSKTITSDFNKSIGIYPICEYGQTYISVLGASLPSGVTYINDRNISIVVNVASPTTSGSINIHFSVEATG